MPRSTFASFLLCALTASGAGVAPAAAADPPPAWLYPVPPKTDTPSYADDAVVTLPGSTAKYSGRQLRDNYVTADWYPNEHPPLPHVVKHGRKPEVLACGHCHRTNGQGGPENATVAGLPYDYIVRQIRDFKSGARSSALPQRGPQAGMIQSAKHLTDAEIDAAAKYFSSLKPAARVRVVETATVPKMVPGPWILTVAPGTATEPIGQRLLEVPESLERFEARDPNARFIAYVPPGSVARGQALAQTGGGGKTLPCAACHGPDLQGLGMAPPLLGHSPSSLLRQLYEIKSGVRHGEQTVQMKPVVANLTLDDMIDLVAYLTSRAP
jgi:cytochrome c553